MERSDDIPQNPTDTTTKSPGTESASDAPDWSLVHFDVACARCGHDLRGRSEPNCPACQLEFDWADAVPLEKITCGKCDYHLYGLSEARCPECGESFDWNEALLNYRRKQKPLFEYRWREQPVRSLIRTWWMALRPGKFWRSIDIHDPPQLFPTLFLALCWFVIIGTQLWALTVLDTLVWWFRFGAGRIDVLYVTRLVMFETLSDEAFYSILVAIASWWCANLMALLIFQQSMARHKVRFAHVLRVVTYSTLPWLPVVLAATFTSSLLLALSGQAYNSSPESLMVLSYLVIVGISVRRGYGNYLRMKHSFAVMFASQIVAVLTCICFLLWMSGSFLDAVIWPIFDLFGY